MTITRYPAWPSGIIQLRDTQVCPSCFGIPVIGVCGRCNIDVRTGVAGLIRLRSQTLDAALLERAGLIAAMRSRQNLPAGTAATLAWPPTALALMDPARCPGCFATLAGSRCEACGLSLNQDDAVELTQVSRAAGDLAEERRRAVLALPVAAYAPPVMSPSAAPVVSPAPSPIPVANPIVSPVPSPVVRPIQSPVTAMVPFDTSVAAADSVLAPATAMPAPPAPPESPRRVAAAPAPPESPRRSSIQTTLLTLGVVLLVAAALFFATLAYLGTTPPVRALILLGVAAATAAVAGFIVRRLPSTAHALAILSTIIALIDAGLVRAFDVAGISGLDPIFSAGLGLGLVGALAVLAERLTHVRSYAFIAALLLPLSAFGLIGSLGTTAFQTVWLGSLAGLVIAVAGSRVLRSRAARAPERLLLESLGLALVVVATGSVPGVAQAGVVLLVFLLGATALAWLGFAVLTTSHPLRITGRTGAVLLVALTPPGLLGTTITEVALAFSPPTLPALLTVVLSTTMTATGIWVLTRRSEHPSLATLLPGWTAWIASAVLTGCALGWFATERAAESSMPNTGTFLTVALPGMAALLLALAPLGFATHHLRALRDVLPWLLGAATLAATLSVFPLESRFAQSIIILAIALALAETSIRLPRRLPGLTFWLVPAGLSAASIVLALVRSPSLTAADTVIHALALVAFMAWRVRAEQDPRAATPPTQRVLLSMGAFLLGLTLVGRIVATQSPMSMTALGGWELVYAALIGILLGVVPALSGRFRVNPFGAAEGRLIGAAAAVLLVLAGAYFWAGLILEPRPGLPIALLPIVGTLGALVPVLRPARIGTGIRLLLSAAAILLAALSVTSISMQADVRETTPVALLLLALTIIGHTPLRTRVLGGPNSTPRRLSLRLNPPETRLGALRHVRIATDLALLLIAIPVFVDGINLVSSWPALPILAVAAAVSSGAHGNPLLRTSGLRRFQLALALGIASCALWVALDRAFISSTSAYVVPVAAMLALLILLTSAINPVHPRPHVATLGLGLAGASAAIGVIADGLRFGSTGALIIGLVALVLAGSARLLRREWRNLPVRALALGPTAGTLIVLALGRVFLVTGGYRIAFPAPAELWAIMLCVLVLVFIPWLRRESFSSIDSVIGLAAFSALVLIGFPLLAGSDHLRASLILLASLFAILAVAGAVYSRWGSPFWIGALGISGFYGVFAWVRPGTAVELALAPLLIAAVLIGILKLRRYPDLRSMPVLGIPLAVGTLASFLAGWGDPHPIRIVGLGIVTIALILWGVFGRLQAPFVIGTGVLLIHVIVQAFPLIRAITDTLSWAVWAGLGGVLLLVVGATYEARLRQAKNLVHAISALR
ncbi:SCO7613 C-terminal domain-containing membrane protein [Mycetocola saprophilus]|uniref:SCO7613 C-terminal domain-containing membrane protein n=1 Tax=Mycetocola saprophilus TaxID=76636 RepID=UPI003BF18941